MILSFDNCISELSRPLLGDCGGGVRLFSNSLMKFDAVRFKFTGVILLNAAHGDSSSTGGVSVIRDSFSSLDSALETCK
jgi:hypothetical protein